MSRKKSQLPPPFMYVVSSGNTGTFLWDGATGAAVYFVDALMVQRGMTFLDLVKFSQGGVSYSYYAFTESSPQNDGQIRKWLFEVEPRAGETLCTVYYYYDKGTPILFGGAEKRTMPPVIDDLTKKLV